MVFVSSKCILQTSAAVLLLICSGSNIAIKELEVRSLYKSITLRLSPEVLTPAGTPCMQFTDRISKECYKLTRLLVELIRRGRFTLQYIHLEPLKFSSILSLHWWSVLCFQNIRASCQCWDVLKVIQSLRLCLRFGNSSWILNIEMMYFINTLPSACEKK